MVKAVIFDLDGVIIDSFAHMFDYFQEYAKNRSGEFPFKDHDELRKIYRDSSTHMEHILGDTCDFSNPTFWVDYNAHKLEAEIPLIAGMGGVIRDLAESTHLAIASTSTQAVIKKHLEAFSLYDRFDVIVGKEDTEIINGKHAIKPHPSALLVALSRLNVNASEALFVGDQLTDLEAANAVKQHRTNAIETIGVTYGFGMPEVIKSHDFVYHANSPKELKEYIISRLD